MYGTQWHLRYQDRQYDTNLNIFDIVTTLDGGLMIKSVDSSTVRFKSLLHHVPKKKIFDKSCKKRYHNIIYLNIMVSTITRNAIYQLHQRTPKFGNNILSTIHGKSVVSSNFSKGFSVQSKQKFQCKL